MADTTVMELPDGRELAWVELGHPEGPAVFAFHGTPGSRLQVAFMAEAIAASGVRLIAPDRPGYGHSTYHRGRTLAGWASDVVCLADHLGIDRFSVIGISGGGPHAAACAYSLPQRVVAAGIVSGVGTLAERGAEEGMMAANVALARLARRSLHLVYPVFGLETLVTRRWPDAALRAAARQFPAADAAVMERPEVRAAFVDDARLASPTTALAAAQDFTLFARDWGFALEEIAVPVHVWHGDADRNVPFGHGQIQVARIPGARFHECPGEGHLLVVSHMGEILHTVSAVADG
jgi:pimeloyl-ACP methyl ester carboxylesterase